MDQQFKHTPLPWTCHSGSIYQDGPDVFPKGKCENGVPIARMDRQTPLTDPTERDENAKFLNHAANNYYQLVDAVKVALSCLDNYYLFTREGNEASDARKHFQAIMCKSLKDAKVI